MSEKPDPSEVAELEDSEGVYERNAEGDLLPSSWHVIEYEDGYRKVRPYPIPTGDFQEFQNMGDDVDLSELSEILAEKFETPDRTAQEWEDTDPKLFMKCLNLLVELATGEKASSEFHSQVQNELETHGTPGNSPA